MRRAHRKIHPTHYSPDHYPPDPWSPGRLARGTAPNCIGRGPWRCPGGRGTRAPRVSPATRKLLIPRPFPPLESIQTNGEYTMTIFDPARGRVIDGGGGHGGSGLLRLIGLGIAAFLLVILFFSSVTRVGTGHV